MPEQLRRYERYLPAEEARELIRERIRAGLPVTAGDIRALGYSLEDARWSAYRREVEPELGIPHRRPRRVRSTVLVTVGSSESESNPPAPISVLPPGELKHIDAPPMPSPATAKGHLSHSALTVAKQMLAALIRRSARALVSVLSLVRAARLQLGERYPVNNANDTTAPSGER